MPLALSVRRADLGALDTPLLVIALGAQPAAAPLDDALRSLDGSLGGALARTLERRDFRGSRDETLHLAGGAKGVQRVLLVGVGSGDRPNALRRAAALAARRAHG